MAVVADGGHADPGTKDGSPDGSVVVLHAGDHYVVRFLRCSSTPFAVVCFEFWKPEPSLAGEFTAERFFRNRQTNAIGIMAADNDWFQHKEIEAALAAIRSALTGYALIGYGGSMGAYAAINFADRLGLQRVIAVCPQYSIDTVRAPYETRWHKEAAQIRTGGGFQNDRIDQVSPPVTGWLIYDPAGEDAPHAAAIQRHHRLTEIHVPFAQHHELRLLQQAGLFTPMLIDMVTDAFDPVVFRQRLRVGRRLSAVFWIGLSAALLQRKWPRAALRAVRQARLLEHPEPGQIDIQEARVQVALGHHAEARQLAESWQNDPSWSWAALPLIAALPAEAPPPVAAQGVKSPTRILRLLKCWRLLR